MEAIGFSETGGRLMNYVALQTRRWSRNAAVYIGTGRMAEGRDVSGAHPASPWVQWPEREGDHLHSPMRINGVVLN
jgi:hypothetical protein